MGPTHGSLATSGPCSTFEWKPRAARRRPRRENPNACRVLEVVELGGLEPPTSWVRSRHRFRPSLAVSQGLSGSSFAMSADSRSLPSFVEIGPTATVFGPVALTALRQAGLSRTRQRGARSSGVGPSSMQRGDGPDAAAFAGRKPGVGHTPDETNGNRPRRKRSRCGYGLGWWGIWCWGCKRVSVRRIRVRALRSAPAR